MKYALIVLLMVGISVLRVLTPNGISIGLLYAIPIFLSTPIRGWKFLVPGLSVLLVLASVWTGGKSFLPVNEMMIDKCLTALTLIILSYMGSADFRRHTLKVSELEEMNDELRERIKKYD